jgi:hypothetical protein
MKIPTKSWFWAWVAATVHSGFLLWFSLIPHDHNISWKEGLGWVMWICSPYIIVAFKAFNEFTGPLQQPYAFFVGAIIFVMDSAVFTLLFWPISKLIVSILARRRRRML